MFDLAIYGKRIAIVGSRDFGLYHDEASDLWKQDLSPVYEFVHSLPDDIIIISGGARGVDTAAVTAAMECSLKYEEYRADWRKLGKSAGFQRNQVIVDCCEGLVAFWDGESRGTAHTISIAEKQKKPVFVFNG